MPGRNEREMQEMTRFVSDGVVELSRLSIRLIHRGTVRPYGSSPGTPVLTGQARSGGSVGVGSPPTFKPPTEAPSFPIFGDNDIDAATSGAKLGDTFFWGNNVEYSPFLEDPATSPQAPQGFLGLSVDEARKEVEGTRIR